MIKVAGQLIAYIREAVKSHGADAMTDIRVRVGSMGPVHRIRELKGVKDQRGFHLLLELDPIPEAQE